MADSIRGKEHRSYPEQIQKGVLLHRAIDTFTDTHPVTRQSNKRLFPKYSHYSRVIVDIFYDHYLARNWDMYSEVPLEEFTKGFYGLLEENLHIMPGPVKKMAPYMISENWLLSYRDLQGIQKVLRGLNRRTGHKSGMDQAVDDLKGHYREFGDEFTTFFEDLVIFSRQKKATL